METAAEPYPFDFAHPNYPLAPLTLYEVGGPAQLALVPRTREEAAAAFVWMQQQPGRKGVLGGGSNVLVADEGFPGILLLTHQVNRIAPLGDHRYEVDAGAVLWDLVTDIMLPNNYAGVGGLTGVPGTVGGAIYMNAGTVSGTTCQLMESVDVVLPDEGTIRRIPMEPALYGYRGQDFCPAGGLILGGVFAFEQAEQDQQAIYDRYIKRRQEVQPKGKCCGSVFKNPQGDHAGRLIESCGLKGLRHGGAMVSDVHANFIMNEDNATAADILWLIEHIRQTVQAEHGVLLDTEVVYVH